MISSVMEKYCIPKFESSCLTLAVLAASSTLCQAGTITLKTAPVVRWGTNLAPAIGYFDSLGEAFAALVQYQAAHFDKSLAEIPFYADRAAGSPFVDSGSKNINGIDNLYSWAANRFRYVLQSDGSYVLKSDPITSGIVAANMNCPDGAVYKFSNTTPDGKVQKAWCEVTIKTRDKRRNECGYGNPIFPAPGLKEQREVDYRSASGALQMERTYRSDIGAFASIASRSVGFSDYQGANIGAACVPRVWTEISYSGGEGVLTKTVRSGCFPVYPDGSKKALLTTRDGMLVEFNILDGVAQSSTSSKESAIKVVDSGGSTRWMVTTESDYIDVYADSGQLLSSWSMSGRKTSYLYSDGTVSTDIAPGAGYLLAQSDEFGRSMYFTYDKAGNLSTMQDPVGGVYKYSFDPQNRLIGVRYPNGLTVDYHWGEVDYAPGANGFQALTGRSETWGGITTRVGSYGYDADGNAISTEGPKGLNRFVVANRQTNQVDLVDPLGASRTMQFVGINDVPHVTSISQPAGSGCSAAHKSSTFDVYGNVTVRDDFSGSRTCYAYAGGRNLETVRVEGLVAGYGCAGVISAGANLPTGSRKISTAWHPDWRVEVGRAEPKRRISWIYNGQPDPFNSGAIASCAPVSAKLPNGKPISVLCKQVEQATSDERGVLGLAAVPIGTPRTSSFTYNQFGQMLTSVDPRGFVTVYEYYDSSSADYMVGDLKSITNPAGHVTQYVRYDKNGRLLKVMDPNGVISEMTYTPRGWLKSLTVTSAGDGYIPLTSNYSYDGVGNVTQTTFPDGSGLNYDYDEAHRLIGISDTAGNRVIYELDAAGNRISERVQDASGVLARNIKRSFDALGRLQQVIGSSQ
ncbi:RHS repeat protein [Mitsuaria sp. WAJ17]|uniref:RHS repeat domain-containing protein n=1 Tax=Mitsuaria sp. WAJ17 TaxID=2761452 RepID=UPI001602BFFF|nr:RHS repeat protein [Mitsuaria sp. WAJ17]MBB2486990.1 RHS repeat protein [Mitsuaria sp. WAJ17]